MLHPERDRLQEYLKERGVGTLIHYPVPPYLAKAYQEFGFLEEAFPISESSESIAAAELSLPIGPHLDLDDAGYIVHTIRESVSGLAFLREEELLATQQFHGFFHTLTE